MNVIEVVEQETETLGKLEEIASRIVFQLLDTQ